METVSYQLVHWELKYKQPASQLEIDIVMVAHKLVHW